MFDLCIAIVLYVLRTQRLRQFEQIRHIAPVEHADTPRNGACSQWSAYT